MGAKRAAKRKLCQELGIKEEQLNLDDFHFITRIHYKALSDGLWGEHEVDYILFIQCKVDVDLNRNECNDYKYVDKDLLKELIRMADDVDSNNQHTFASETATIKQSGVTLTPWFRLIAKKFLFGWWDHLSNVKSIQDVQTIHRFL